MSGCYGRREGVPRKRIEQTPTFEVWSLKPSLLKSRPTTEAVARMLLSTGRSDYDRARVGELVHEGIVDLRAYHLAKFPPDQQRAANFDVDAMLAAIDRCGVWIGDGVAIVRRAWKRPERWNKGLIPDERERARADRRDPASRCDR